MIAFPCARCSSRSARVESHLQGLPAVYPALELLITDHWLELLTGRYRNWKSTVRRCSIASSGYSASMADTLATRPMYHTVLELASMGKSTGQGL